MSQDLIDYGINYALDKGTSYVEARMIEGRKRGFFLRNEALISSSKTPWIGIGFRVLVNGGLGFCSVEQMTQASVRSALDNVIKMAKISNPLEKINFGDPVSNKAKWGIDVKEDLDNVDNDQIIKILKNMDNYANSLNISARSYIYEDWRYKKYLKTSEGTDIEADLSMIKFLSILSTKGKMGPEQRMVDLTRSTGFEGTTTWMESFKNECDILVKVAEHAEKGLKAGEVIDYIVSPEIAGIIAHENAGHPSEGDRILGREGAQAGESFWRDLKLKESCVGSEHVTICDDPTIPKTGGYYLFDDEGVKSRNRVLIKKGIINEPLLNREFGNKFNLQSNGSSRAENFDREPIIRMANTYFEPGDFTLEELIEDVKYGVLMNSFTEWNIDDRRFQSKYVGQECYLIENGEVKEKMIRRPALETTTVGLFSAIDGVTNKISFDFPGICGKSDPGQGVPVYAGGGHIRMRNIRIS